VCKEYIAQRWKETGWIKFMETDMEMLRTVCECFESYREKDNILYLDRKLDYSKDDWREEVNMWLDIQQY
jgi:hypothetical protein